MSQRMNTSVCLDAAMRDVELVCATPGMTGATRRGHATEQPLSPSARLLRETKVALERSFDADLKYWWRAKLLMVPAIVFATLSFVGLFWTVDTANAARVHLVDTANFQLVQLSFVPMLFTFQFVAAMLRSASVAAVFPTTREWTAMENANALSRVGTGTGKLHFILNWLSCALLWGFHWVPSLPRLPMTATTCVDLVGWTLLLIVVPVLCSMTMKNLRVGLLRRERGNAWPYVRKLLYNMIICAVFQLSVSSYMLSNAMAAPTVSIRPFQRDYTAHCSSFTKAYVHQYCNASIDAPRSDLFGSVVYDCDDGGFEGFSSRMTYCKASLVWDRLRNKGLTASAASLFSLFCLFFREGVAAVCPMTSDESILTLLEGRASACLSVAIICASVGAAFIPIISMRPHSIAQGSL